MIRRLENSRRDERGSAFLVALVVIAILTVVGMSVIMVTETEMLLGGTERMLNESFYVTETGTSTLAAQLFVTNALDPVDVVMPSLQYNPQSVPDGQAPPARLGFRVRSAGPLPIQNNPLPYTKANSDKDTLVSVYFIATVDSQRTAWDWADDLPECDDLEDISSREYRNLGFFMGPMESPSGSDFISSEIASLDTDGWRNEAGGPGSGQLYCQHEIDEADDELGGTTPWGGSAGIGSVIDARKGGLVDGF
ncbi:MAG: pilus assembly PilX N-terminal domain-containing protein [Acidobacteriota bacterium]